MRDLELLVIDDGSTDATAETVAAHDDERLRYLVQPENRGGQLGPQPWSARGAW